jgi:hypothetical protein
MFITFHPSFTEMHRIPNLELHASYQSVSFFFIERHVTQQYKYSNFVSLCIHYWYWKEKRIKGHEKSMALIHVKQSTVHRQIINPTKDRNFSSRGQRSMRPIQSTARMWETNCPLQMCAEETILHPTRPGLTNMESFKTERTILWA